MESTKFILIKMPREFQGHFKVIRSVGGPAIYTPSEQITLTFTF